MSSSRREEETFDAIRQFVIAPDRRYQIEWRDDALHFCKTGSQFDVQWLARGARARLGEGIAGKFERSSPRKLFLGGIGVAAGSALLLVLIGIGAAVTTAPIGRRHLQGIGVLVFAFTVGLIMIVAGIATKRGSSSGSRHNFSLGLPEIADAKLLSPQSELARRGEPQVARLHLQPRSGGVIRLGIPTESDLETVKRAIPQLAA